MLRFEGGREGGRAFMHIIWRLAVGTATRPMTLMRVCGWHKPLDKCWVGEGFRVD